MRLDTLDEEVITLLKKVGFYSINVEIESGSQRILNLMKKNLSIQDIREKVNLINKAGLDAGGFFILGFPQESTNEIRQTIDFAKELPLKRAEFSDFKPLPGTEATYELLKKREISDISYNNLISHKVSYVPKGISPSQLKWWQRRAFFEFYLRPTIILSLLRSIRSIGHLKALIKRILIYLF